MSNSTRAHARRLGATAIAVALAGAGWTGPAAAFTAEPAVEPATTADGSANEAALADPVDDRPSVEDLTPEELARRQEQTRIDSAQLHYERGTVLYDNKRYAEAAAEFESSYAAVPAATTLYAMALSYERASKSVEAVRALQRYLALPDCSSLPPNERKIGCTKERADAEESLAEQMRLVGELDLALAEGVQLREVRVAGRTIPLDDFPMLLLPGAVDVELFGMKPDERRSRVAYITAGEPFMLYVAPFESEVVVRPQLPSDVGSPDLLRRQRQQRALRTTFWVGAGLTTASAIGLGVVGGLTLYHQRRHAIEKCEPLCSVVDDEGELVLNPDGTPMPLNSGYPQAHRDAFRRYLPITNAMVGVTIGLAVGTALVAGFAFQKRNRGEAHVQLRGPGLALRW